MLVAVRVTEAATGVAGGVGVVPPSPYAASSRTAANEICRMLSTLFISKRHSSP